MHFIIKLLVCTALARLRFSPALRMPKLFLNNLQSSERSIACWAGAAVLLPIIDGCRIKNVLYREMIINERQRLAVIIILYLQCIHILFRLLFLQKIHIHVLQSLPICRTADT